MGGDLMLLIEQIRQEKQKQLSKQFVYDNMFAIHVFKYRIVL